MRPIAAILVSMIALACVFCQGKKVTSAVVVEPVKPQDSLELTAYSVHLVKLRFEYITKDQQGAKKQYAKAWLIKLELKNMPAYPAQRVDFAIGDYIIPEYGGWAKGIYFRVYEQQLLDKLNKQEIRYRLPGSDRMIATKRMFEMPMDKMEIEDENKVLGRDN